LATYNILHNIKYKELFQISWEFAFAHSHIRSVRMDKPLSDETDNDAKLVERKRRNTAFVHAGIDSGKFAQSQDSSGGSFSRPSNFMPSESEQSSHSLPPRPSAAPKHERDQDDRHRHRPPPPPQDDEGPTTKRPSL